MHSIVTIRGRQPFKLHRAAPQVVFGILTLSFCAPLASGQRSAGTAANKPQRQPAPAGKTRIQFVGPLEDLASPGLKIAPTIVWTRGSARQKSHIDFHLDNLGSRTKVAAYLQLLPFLPAEEGWPYNLVATHPHDATAWFTTPTQTYVLAPHKDRAVQLNFTAPAGAKGCYWTLLRVIPKPTNSDTVGPDDADASRNSLGYFVPIFIVVGNARPATVVISRMDCKCQHPGENYNSLGVTVTNESEGVSRLGIEVEVRNVTGALAQQGGISDRFLLPQSRRRLFVPISPLPDGQYKARVRVVQDLRRLPPIYIEFAVSAGKAKTLTADASLSLAPVIVDPGAVSLNLKPGERRSTIVSLTNNASRPLHLRLVPCAVKQSRDGAIGPDDNEREPPGGLKVMLSPEDVTIAPGRRQNVRLTVETDRQMDGDFWFGARIQEVDNAQSLPENFLGSVQVATAKQPTPQLELAEPSFEQQDGPPSALKFVVRNPGNRAVIPEGAATLFKSDGVTQITRLAVPDWNGQGILPGSELDNRVLLPSPLPPGRYTVEVKYAYQNDVVVKRVNFEIVAARPAQHRGVVTKARPVKAKPAKVNLTKVNSTQVVQP